MWMLARRARLLPEGGAVSDGVLAPVMEEIEKAIAFARMVTDVARDDLSRALWTEVYPRLSEGEDGLIGAVLAPAEAQVLRASVLYALLDQSRQVRPPHLRAALAVWQYAEASARIIFAGRLGIPLPDAILGMLRQRGPMTKNEIWAALGRNGTAAD